MSQLISHICRLMLGQFQLLQWSKARLPDVIESTGAGHFATAQCPLMFNVVSLPVCFAAHSHYLYGYTLAAFRE